MLFNWFSSGRTGSEGENSDGEDGKVRPNRYHLNFPKEEIRVMITTVADAE
jgi:hypothetical protein